MKLIHTADWHLGGKLHEQERSGEHERFLHWLKNPLCDERPDALLVAGEAFDTFAPSNRALDAAYANFDAVRKLTRAAHRGKKRRSFLPQ